MLLKSLTVADPQSPFNGQTVDILLNNGRIVEIGQNVKADGETKTFEAGTFISPGFFDLHVHFGEPGLEINETLESGSRAALAGGFTGVCLMPDTNPALDSRTSIEFVKSRATKLPINIFPAGTISVSRDGKDMAEMYDMQQGGAVAFTDHKRSLADPGLMQRSLLYAKGINALVMNFPQVKELCHGGLMNEGITSTMLGMKGLPNIAEYLCVNRDIALCRYLDTTMHISCISTAESVELIREAKQKGLKITCDVSAHNLFFTDKELNTFDSNLKLSPPVRTAKDIKALIAGLKDNTIDAISSDHRPENIENKNVEFDYASNGAIGLESFFGQIYKVLEKEIPLSQIIELIALNPRNILGIEKPSIQKGAKAEFTIFNTKEEWTFEEADIKSKSKNSPVVGRELKGKVVTVIN